jgi:hypothetical protein
MLRSLDMIEVSIAVIVVLLLAAFTLGIWVGYRFGQTDSLLPADICRSACGGAAHVELVETYDDVETGIPHVFCGCTPW